MKTKPASKKSEENHSPLTTHHSPAPAIDGRLPLKKQRIPAGPCPRSEHHTSTRVYRVVGTKRYAICDDCGHAWVQPNPEAAEAK